MLSKIAVCLSVLGMVLGVGASTASAISVTIDEFGNGSLDLNGIVQPLTSFLLPDPSGGVTEQPVLVYMSPITEITEGDVYISDVGGGGAISDVVRFYRGLIIFYSDSIDGFDAPADVPHFPTNPQTNIAFADEIGTEGNNYAIYTPAQGQPGAMPLPVTYTFISDGPGPAVVPEPITLAGFGLLSLLGGARFGLGRMRRKA